MYTARHIFARDLSFLVETDSRRLLVNKNLNLLNTYVLVNSNILICEGEQKQKTKIADKNVTYGIDVYWEAPYLQLSLAHFRNWTLFVFKLALL